jgi:putative flippase GtrA
MTIASAAEAEHIRQLLRYIVNGVQATAVHFAVLAFNMEVVGFTSAGLANLIAAGAGITASFLGNRYFVFRKTAAPILHQALRFSGLYVSIAFLHGAILAVWTDWLAQDYRIGFLIATAFQFSLSYLGNKWMVFR